MKPIVLALIAFLLALGMYVLYTSLNGVKPFSDLNTSKIESSTAETQSEAETKTSVKKEKKAEQKKTEATPESKRIFLKKTIAAIRKVKARLDAQYETVYKLSLKKTLTHKEKRKIEQLKKRYKVEGIPCLLKRLHTHPISIVIAQAALESGWGSSRFYREANNIFGIWSYDPYEPRMAAGKARKGKKTVYVKKYKNLEASIESYYRMMANGRAYKQFRTARLHTDNPFEMIAYLDHYSELRHEYVKRLYYVIKSNRFYELDNPVYQPPAWKNIRPAKAEYHVPKKEVPAAKVADKCKKRGDDDITDIIGTQERERSVAPGIGNSSGK